MKIYTIGFTKKTAEEFFSLLKDHGINQLVDIRLRPNSQLAGFAKGRDLPYFLKELIQSDYSHQPNLAPTGEILDSYRKDKDWEKYVSSFEELMDQRDIPDSLDRATYENHVCCLLCSEATPEQCHRRLVAERLANAWGEVEIIHL